MAQLTHIIGVVCFIIRLFTKAHAALSCPTDWVVSEDLGICIKVSTGTTSWDTARVVCQMEGADLVTILSPEVNDFVAATAAEYTEYTVWIGLNNFEDVGSFVWLDEETEASWTNWREGQPDYSDASSCVYMYLLDDNKWGNIHCSNQFNYICGILGESAAAPDTTVAYTTRSTSAKTSTVPTSSVREIGLITTSAATPEQVEIKTTETNTPEDVELATTAPTTPQDIEPKTSATAAPNVETKTATATSIEVVNVTTTTNSAEDVVLETSTKENPTARTTDFSDANAKDGNIFSPEDSTVSESGSVSMTLMVVVAVCAVILLFLPILIGAYLYRCSQRKKGRRQLSGSTNVFTNNVYAMENRTTSTSVPEPETATNSQDVPGPTGRYVANDGVELENDYETISTP